MQPPEIPIPPSASRPRREMPSSLLSPSFSRCRLPPTAASAADGDSGGAVSEHPYVELFEWWLARVEGDDKKIAVAGLFQRNQTVLPLAPAPIAKRHEARILETEDGVVLHIYGSPNLSRMHGNGYMYEVCEKFMIGFPYWWESCNHLYPKETKSHAGCQPSSSFTSNTEKDKQFYLEKYQLGERLLHGATFFSEHLKSFKRMSPHKDTAFQKSSHLSNGAPRFEEYTCDGDILTNENAAASNGEISLIALSEKAAVDEGMPTSVCIDVHNSSYLLNEIPRFEKKNCLGDIPTNEDAAALNDDSERCTAVLEEVNSMEIGLTVGSAIKERGHDDITTNVSLDPTVECTNEAVNEGVDSTSLLGCKKTPVAALKSQHCREKHLQIPSNEKRSAPKKQRSELEKLQGPTRSPFTSPVPYAHESPLTRGRATSLSMSTPEALKLRKSRSGRVLVPTLDAGCQRIVYDMDGMITGVIGLDSPSPKGSKLKTCTRKKREAEPAAASKVKTYARKKREAEPAAASKLKTYARKKRRAEPAASSKLKTYARRKKTRAE